MIDFGGLFLQIKMAEMRIERERQIDEKMRSLLTPEQYRDWKAEQTAERRHQEICRAIERAGDNARPRGGIFSGFR